MRHVSGRWRCAEATRPCSCEKWLDDVPVTRIPGGFAICRVVQLVRNEVRVKSGAKGGFAAGLRVHPVVMSRAKIATRSGEYSGFPCVEQQPFLRSSMPFADGRFSLSWTGKSRHRQSTWCSSRLTQRPHCVPPRTGSEGSARPHSQSRVTPIVQRTSALL